MSLYCVTIKDNDTLNNSSPYTWRIRTIPLHLTRTICFALTIRASKRLHDAMTRGVLRAKVEFFDTNPSGRILNRFSADVGSNDDLLPNTLFDLLACAFIMLGAILTAVVALPFILVVLPPLFWYFLRVRGIFVTSSREVSASYQQR